MSYAYSNPWLVAAILSVCGCGDIGVRNSREGTVKAADGNPTLAIELLGFQPSPDGRTLQLQVVTSNRTKDTVSFLNHPEFVLVKAYAGGAELEMEHDGIHFVKPDHTHVVLLEAGKRQAMTVWAYLADERSRDVDKVSIELLPPSVAALPNDVARYLAKDNANPLRVSVQSGRLAVPKEVRD